MLVSVALAASLGGCMGGCTLLRSPADLPSRLEVTVTPETGSVLFETPVINTVVAEVHERDAGTFATYKLDRVDILDGDAVLETTRLPNPSYSGRVFFKNVKVGGPDGRTGCLYARIIDSDDPKYNVKSDCYPFTVKAKPSSVFMIEDGSPYDHLRFTNPPANAATVSVIVGDTDYGMYVVTDVVSIFEPSSTVGLTLTWYDADGRNLGVTEATIP
jgi:hypothetical protein